MLCPTCFNAFLQYLEIPDGFEFSRESLEKAGIDVPLYEELHLLKKAPIPSGIDCPTCDESAEIGISYYDGKPEIRAFCPNCGYFYPPKWMLDTWVLDFEPLLEPLYREFHCYENTTECIPGFLWKLGRCGLSGQSREIYVCRGLGGCMDDKIIESLPKDKTSLLLVAGKQEIFHDYGDISNNRIFHLSSVLSIRNCKICADITAIKVALDLLIHMNHPKTRGPGKYANIGDCSKKVQLALRDFFLETYSAAEHAERMGHSYDFRPLTQKELAQRIETNNTMICRVINGNPDLKKSLQYAQSFQTAYAFGKRASQNHSFAHNF